MTSFILRLIAIIAMLLDHAAYTLMTPGTEEFVFIRSVGRIAFPIFCFLIVEGFEHTRSVEKYIARLAAFALISEIPFDLAFHRTPLEFAAGQNVFLTLLLGLAAITFAGKIIPMLMKHSKMFEKHTENRLMQIFLASPVIFLCGWLAKMLHTDYGWFGVAVICIFYLLRSKPALALISFSILNILHYCVQIIPLESSRALFSFQVIGMETIQWFAPFAALPIGFYNGQPGEKKFRALFYVFYPAHLLILWALSLIIY